VQEKKTFIHYVFHITLNTLSFPHNT